MVRRNRKVVNIIDGDTFEIAPAIEGERKVRIAAINTPESKEKGFAKAKDFLEKKILGKTVTLDILALDKYHRIVSYVYLDGKSVAKMLVKKGLCVA
jgi:endonuclease YncB( thermonuclease family)